MQVTTHGEPQQENTTLEGQLVALLEELSSTQAELLELLSAKRACMAKSDLPGMQALEERQQRLCERLEACHDRRGELLGTAREQGVEVENLQELAQRLDDSPTASLHAQTREAAARIRLLQHESLSNWVLAQRTLLHLSQMVEIIATGGKIQPTYGKQGPGTRGSLVDRAA